MLDYTLVSAKATYRLLTPQDLPIFLRLAQAAWAERDDLPPFDPQRVLATVKELQPARGRGSIYVFEREQRLAGFCFLVNCWSSAECGTVLVADELYVDPHRAGERPSAGPPRERGSVHEARVLRIGAGCDVAQD